MKLLVQGVNEGAQAAMKTRQEESTIVTVDGKKKLEQGVGYGLKRKKAKVVQEVMRGDLQESDDQIVQCG